MAGWSTRPRMGSSRSFPADGPKHHHQRQANHSTHASTPYRRNCCLNKCFLFASSPSPCLPSPPPARAPQRKTRPDTHSLSLPLKALYEEPQQGYSGSEWDLPAGGGASRARAGYDPRRYSDASGTSGTTPRVTFHSWADSVNFQNRLGWNFGVMLPKLLNECLWIGGVRAGRLNRRHQLHGGGR